MQNYLYKVAKAASCMTSEPVSDHLVLQPLLTYLPDNTAPSGSTPLHVKSVAMAIATNVLVLALVVIFV